MCSWLIEQAILFKPNAVVIANEAWYSIIRGIKELSRESFAGAAAMEQVVQMETIDIVLAALVGYSGLMPTIEAIRAGKTIALANKETLVVAGEVITSKWPVKEMLR
jgi:1-deoxy-D-xylulose-5-phosphate reductoisomerase